MAVVETKPESPNETMTAENPERERLQNEILDRMILCFRESQMQQPVQEYNPWLEQRVSKMTSMAKLFLGFPIAFWPPKLLIRKMVRRLVLPLFSPQVEFNTAARDVILELRQRNETQSAILQEAVQQISLLEERIEILNSEINTLRVGSKVSSKGTNGIGRIG